MPILTHIRNDHPKEPGELPLCGAAGEHDYDYLTYYEYISNILGPLDEFCEACEAEVYKKHPQPDLLKLARTEL